VSPSFDMTARVRKHPRRWLHAVGEAGCAEPSRTMDQMLNATGL